MKNKLQFAGAPGRGKGTPSYSANNAYVVLPILLPCFWSHWSIYFHLVNSSSWECFIGFISASICSSELEEVSSSLSLSRINCASCAPTFLMNLLFDFFDFSFLLMNVHLTFRFSHSQLEQSIESYLLVGCANYRWEKRVGNIKATIGDIWRPCFTLGISKYSNLLQQFWK